MYKQGQFLLVLNKLMYLLLLIHIVLKYKLTDNYYVKSKLNLKLLLLNMVLLLNHLMLKLLYFLMCLKFEFRLCLMCQE